VLLALVETLVALTVLNLKMVEQVVWGEQLFIVGYLLVVAEAAVVVAVTALVSQELLEFLAALVVVLVADLEQQTAALVLQINGT
jgi:hypothetical protein